MKIKDQIKQFNESLTSLKEFTELIEPILLQRKEKMKIPLPDKMRTLLDLAIQKIKPIEEDERVKDIVKLQGALDLLSSVSNLSQKLETNVFSNSHGAMNDVEYLLGVNPNTFKKITNTYDKDLHITNLYKNNLISLLSAVEWFFAQLLHNFYNEFPESPGINKKTLTFEDLKGFKTIKDAERYLIERKIEELLRGSIDSWFDYLREDLKLKINFVKPFINELIEISQRRNLFVHNGGIVNTIYLAKVKKPTGDDILINQPLSIDREYIENSINLMETVFTLLAAELWKKLYAKDSERGEFIVSISFDYLMQERWKDAEILTDFAINDELQDAHSKTISQLNNWLCKKRLGNWEQISSELNKLDFSDKQTKYQLALSSLKEDYDAFFNLLPECLNKQEISAVEIELFPIFKEMRESTLYSEFMTIFNSTTSSY